MKLTCKLQFQLDDLLWSKSIQTSLEKIDLKPYNHFNICRISLENNTSFYIMRQDDKWYGLQKDGQVLVVKEFDGTCLYESDLEYPLEKLSELIKSIRISEAFIQKIFHTEESKDENIVSEKDLLIKYTKKLEQDVMKIVKENPERNQQVDALKKYLLDNYKRICGTGLDYVATPDIVATQAIIEIAKIIAHEQEISVIEVLMPGIAHEQTGYVNLADLKTVDIQEVIRTHHFLNKNEQLFLIPVSYLEFYVKDIPDVYFPYMHNGNYYKVEDKDYRGLFNHSEQTMDVYKKLIELKKISEEFANLYKQLTIFVKILQKNDANHAGKVTDAGGGAYTAAVPFFEYYAKLEKCLFISKNSAPSLEDLPADTNMAYCLYDSTLYFINRYDGDNPVKQITQINQFARFEIFVSSVDDISTQTLSERPLIVKNNQNEFYFIGNDNKAISLEQEKILPIYKSFPNTKDHVIPLSLESIAPCVFKEMWKKGIVGNLLCDDIKKKFPENKILSINELQWIGLQTDHFYTDEYFMVPEDIRQVLNKMKSFLLHPYEFYKITKDNTASKIIVETNLKTCIGTQGAALKNTIPRFQSQLQLIGENKNLKVSKIKDSQDNLDQSFQTLKKHKFHGNDKNLKFNITSLESILGKVIIADLSILERFDFKDLKPENLELSNIDDNVIGNLILNTNNEKLELLLPLIKNYISDELKTELFDLLEECDSSPLIILTHHPELPNPEELIPKLKLLIPYYVRNFDDLRKANGFIRYCKQS